ncbi:ABC transporter permease [Pseudarthrobacter sulfonivorans]|uniref:ABC transporter permease n=1 Tax=Pseudarthrobacter sulfonivorans TaxID=121292 RepID=UPI001428C88A|nr:ABC transporter permease [Pseudarthrobacter sulfonivorans]
MVVIIIVMILAPVIAPSDPLAQDIANKRLPVFTPGHLLGTDELGRDVLTRIMYGARIELFIALGATVFAAIAGTFMGIVGGFFGGIAETVTMRLIVDVILAFPPIILALLAVTIYGPGPITLIMVMGVLFAPTFARITYGQTLSVKREEYVEAARAFGAKTPVTLFKVILPNVSAPIIVQFSLTMAQAILLESGLSYLGLGVVPPEPSWGAMVAEGQRYITSDPMGLLVPSAALVLTILAFGLLGDGLRAYLDPKSRK